MHKHTELGDVTIPKSRQSRLIFLFARNRYGRKMHTFQNFMAEIPAFDAFYGNIFSVSI